MSEETVLLQKDGRTATITLNRPPLNILDIPTIDRLGEVIASLETDPELTLIVIRAAGDRAFSTGVAVQDHTPDRVGPMLESLHGTLRRLRGLDAVTVAAVHGFCLGGGMELALACDLVIATEDARFSQPEIELGCYAPVASALLPARLGMGRTLDLLLTARILSCAEAHELGLVTYRVPAGEIGLAVANLAGGLATRSAPVVRLTKKAVRAGRDLPFDKALTETERIYKEELLPLEDLEEGAAAFLAKRKPLWKHR